MTALVQIVDSSCTGCGKSAFLCEPGYRDESKESHRSPMTPEEVRALVEHSACMFCGGQPQVVIEPWAPAPSEPTEKGN